jgi:ABC-type glycerol-3-phosphate transport system substrate-binding protein
MAWEKTLEALELISSFDPIDPTWRETEWAETQEDFLNEEYLFYINGSWMYNIWSGIDKVRTLNCMPTEFPGFKPHKIYPAAYQVTWGVLKNAPHKQEAVDFILAMNTPEIAEAWSRYTKCPTGLKGNLVSTNFGGDQFENFANYVQTKFGTNIYRYYESGIWVLNDNFSAEKMNFREVIEGEMTAEEAMRRLRRKIGR